LPIRKTRQESSANKANTNQGQLTLHQALLLLHSKFFVIVLRNWNLRYVCSSESGAFGIIPYQGAIMFRFLVGTLERPKNPCSPSQRCCLLSCPRIRGKERGTFECLYKCWHIFGFVLCSCRLDLLGYGKQMFKTLSSFVGKTIKSKNNNRMANSIQRQSSRRAF
jgi:hypothetical protein